MLDHRLQLTCQHIALGFVNQALNTYCNQAQQLTRIYFTFKCPIQNVSPSNAQSTILYHKLIGKKTLADTQSRIRWTYGTNKFEPCTDTEEHQAHPNSLHSLEEQEVLMRITCCRHQAVQNQIPQAMFQWEIDALVTLPRPCHSQGSAIQQLYYSIKED